MLMLFADDTSRPGTRCVLDRTSFTMRWQSSNVPRTASDVTLPPQHVNCLSWRGETRPSGKRSVTRMPGRWWKAAATAPPVSPEVATRISSGFVRGRCV